MRSLGIQETKRIMVVASPIRSRGCADVGPSTSLRREGDRVVIAIAPPRQFRLLRLANLTRHELSHTQGFDHEEMEPNLRYSQGPMPGWAKRFDRPNWPRYKGRAPNQMLG